MRSALFAALTVVTATSVARGAALGLDAAVSLTEPLREATATYTGSSGDAVALNLGASSTLALQIRAGAPADVFFSADEATMDALEKQGLLLTGTRRSLLSNVLVIVVGTLDSIPLRAPRDLGAPRIRHLALAEPRSVPAGVYAKQWLVGQGLWDLVADKVVPTENARAALAAVESGNVEAGIVYATDAKLSKRVRVAYEVPRESGPRISYPVAILAGSKQVEAARRFLAFLESDAAMQIFTKYGFLAAGGQRAAQ